MNAVSSILVSGNTTLDIITVCDAPYNLSGKRPVAQFKQMAGGQAANVADLLANFGNQVSFVGAIGNDFTAKLVLEDFARAGIEVGHSSFCDAPHHLAFVRVDQNNGERFIDMYRDIKLVSDKADLSEQWIKKFDCIYIDNHEPELAFQLGQLGQQHHITVVADLEEVNADTSVILPYIDVLIAPAKIIQQIGNSSHTQLAAKNLAATGMAAVVATQGSDGCFGVSGNQSVSIRGASVAVKDTTGAGDAFHGAFIHSMLVGHDFPVCLATANAIAAQKCTVLGPRLPAEQAQTFAPTAAGQTYFKEKWRRMVSHDNKK